MLKFEVDFEPATPEEKEESRRQRIANMTDQWPELADLMRFKTWREIYDLSMVRHKV